MGMFLLNGGVHVLHFVIFVMKNIDKKTAQTQNKPAKYLCNCGTTLSRPVLRLCNGGTSISHTCFATVQLWHNRFARLFYTCATEAQPHRKHVLYLCNYGTGILQACFAFVP
jgi:hypothetical protein